MCRCIALVMDEQPRGGQTGCDVTISDHDVTQLESCLDGVGRSLVVDYTKSQKRRRKGDFDLCRSSIIVHCFYAHPL